MIVTEVEVLQAVESAQLAPPLWFGALTVLCALLLQASPPLWHALVEEVDAPVVRALVGEAAAELTWIAVDALIRQLPAVPSQAAFVSLVLDEAWSAAAVEVTLIVAMHPDSGQSASELVAPSPDVAPLSSVVMA